LNQTQSLPQHPILLVDDEPAWLHSLSFTLEYTGNYQNLLICNDGRDLIGMLRCQPVSLILLDLVMPNIGGEDLLIQVAQEFPEVPVIVLSGLNQLETAVRCMKLGAFDYYVKTGEPDRLLSGIRKALEMRALQRENRELTTRLLRRELKSPELFTVFNTCSPKLEAIFHYLEAIAGSRAPLLISGEPGTGKRLAARILHALASPDAPWVELPGAGLNEKQFDTVFFGDGQHQGILEQSRGGVIYLEGVDGLSVPVQARLTQLLRQGEYQPEGAASPLRLDVRLVCSTRADLAELVGECRFRKDLFYHLSSHQICMPSLRERPEDLPLLVEKFVDEACMELGWRKPSLPRSLTPLLASYPFPGNVGELREVIAAGVRQGPPGRLSLQFFHDHLQHPNASAADPGEAQTPPLLIPGRMPTLEEARDLVIREALRRAKGNQSIAARYLGITQPALSIYLKKSGMSPSR